MLKSWGSLHLESNIDSPLNSLNFTDPLKNGCFPTVNIAVRHHLWVTESKRCRIGTGDRGFEERLCIVSGASNLHIDMVPRVSCTFY